MIFSNINETLIIDAANIGGINGIQETIDPIYEIRPIMIDADGNANNSSDTDWIINSGDLIVKTNGTLNANITEGGFPLLTSAGINTGGVEFTTTAVQANLSCPYISNTHINTNAELPGGVVAPADLDITVATSGVLDITAEPGNIFAPDGNGGVVGGGATVRSDGDVVLSPVLLSATTTAAQAVAGSTNTRINETAIAITTTGNYLLRCSANIASTAWLLGNAISIFLTLGGTSPAQWLVAKTYLSAGTYAIPLLGDGIYHLTAGTTIYLGVRSSRATSVSAGAVLSAIKIS